MAENLDITLYKPRYEEGLLRDISHGYYLKLTQLQQIKVRAGILNGIPQRWKLIVATISIDTDGNAGNRYIGLITYSKNIRTLESLYSEAVAANEVGSWGIGQALNMIDAIPATPFGYTGTNGLVIEGNQYHEISIFGAKAGDLWHADLCYEYLGEGTSSI